MLKLVVILGFLVSFAAGLVVGSRTDWLDVAMGATSPSSSTIVDDRTPPAPGPDRTAAPPPPDRDRGDGRPPRPPGPRGGPGGPGGRGDRDRGPGGWLAAELRLTPDQHKQLDAIWSDLAQRGRRRDHEGRRRAMRNERDLAVAALIAPARWGEYEQIMADFAERSSALDREFRADFDAAVERTKQILTPEQRTRYEKLLERHRWGPPGGPPPARGRPGQDHRDDRAPDSAPASRPAE
jgi:Spy/CpxP family protein refolding chaperone